MTYQTTNDFTVTRQDGTYTGATNELVVSNGGTVTLPTPTAGEKFGVRALQNDVTIVQNGAIEGSTSDRRVSADGNSVFVSDGSEWYLVSGNEYFGYDIPDAEPWQDNRWVMNEGSGSVLNDDVGSTNATLNGPAWESVSDATGGQTITLDGVDDYWITDSRLTLLDGPLTVCGWVRPEDMVSFQNPLLSVKDTTDPDAKENGWYVDTDGDSALLTVERSGTASSVCRGVPFVNPSEWGFFAILIGGGNHRLITYSNSQELADQSASGGSGGSADGYLFGGGGESGRFDGDHDYFSVAQNELVSKSDITTLWESTQR